MDSEDMALPAEPDRATHKPSPASGLGHSVGVPSAWPSRADVLAELRRRNPERYNNCLNLSYTPGTGDGATVEQIADQFEHIDRELADPRKNLISRLGGMVFLLEDACRPQTDFGEGWPGKPVELSFEERSKQRTYRECAKLMRRAMDMLASGIEAGTGETPVEAARSEGREPGPQGDAQNQSGDT